MTEHIVGTDGHEGHWYTGEEIVRCRDCKHMYEERKGGYSCGSDQWSTASLMPAHEVTPEGFCAWGEHREVS